MEFHLTTYVLLAAASYFAGLIDSIAGGGGLISLPAILAAGIPAHFALGTNKLQSVIGGLASTSRYLRSGHLVLQPSVAGGIVALLSAAGGAGLVLLVPVGVLQTVLPVLLVVASLSLLLINTRGRISRKKPAVPGLAAYLLPALVFGFYDGFFGPGTGTFLVVALLIATGREMLHATAHARIFNFASNIAAVSMFLAAGTVLWPVAIVMGASNVAGAWTGSGLAIRNGARVIKPVLFLVLAGLLVFLILR